LSTNLDKVIACLRELELRPNMHDYKWRFITQKTTFLAQALGMDIGYNDFTIYVAGPYSRSLNCDYYSYENKAKINNLQTDYTLSPAENSILTRIKECCDIYESQSLMESTATIVYLMVKFNERIDEDIISFMKLLKPQIKDKDRIIGLTKAKELLFRDDYLTEEIAREMEDWDRIDE
jgi:uncharacterized protein YwgA